MLGASDVGYNDICQVVSLRYGTFDVLFTGDADTRVEPNYEGQTITPDGIEILKVPHHGSKTGMDEAFLSWVHPKIAVISVGRKNSYGHPTQEILNLLSAHNVNVFRTDKNGDVVVESDGKEYKVTVVKQLSEMHY